jgi:uncharacterized membrane protein YhaH (DUF805 family)
MDELVGAFAMLAVGVWVGGAFVAAWVAWEKGREPVAWFVVAFFLSPLVALVALNAVPARRLARRREEPAAPVVVAAPRVNGLPRDDRRWADRKVKV